MCKVFYYKNFDFLPEKGLLTCRYGVDDLYLFQETIEFPGAPFVLSDKKKKVLDQIFRLAHVAMGISYYKAFLPEKIVVENGGLTETEARFFEKFYLNGLGEFAVRNGLNLQGKIRFPAEKIKRESIGLDLMYAALIPVGGGKDSCVTMELIKKTDLPAVGIAVGDPRPIRECLDISRLLSVILKRKIDPLLMDLNAKGTVYNGHVPITGILAFLLWAAAVLYDKRYVIMSCERSASVGNMMQGTLEINHQYSKSFDFERDFYHITQEITPDFRYFSLLRPLSEAHIAKLFAEKCSVYFSAFTSCNKAFKLDESKRLRRWCGVCDKCRFVFLILAPFMDKETLVSLIGTNPLNDSTQVGGYGELLGLSGHKPFECVGEFEESRWAFEKLSRRPDWQNDVVIRALTPELPKAKADSIFTPSSQHFIPKDLKNVLDEFRR